MTPPAPEQVERNTRGVAACRAAIVVRHIEPEPERPLTPTELIHRRALEMARATRTRHR